MMERLTDKYWRNFDPWEFCGQDNYCLRGCHDPGGCTNGCIVPKLYCRLAAYEDTGLKPGDLKELADVLSKISPQALEHISNLIQAEQDGRLVVLPWAVGETIYEADPEHGVVKHTLVDAAWCMHSKAEDRKGNAWYDFWDAADTAYKIREDAEAALSAKEENK